MVYYGPYRPHFSATVEQLDATGDAEHAAGWSNWGEWGECSKTCGGGMRARHRACVATGGKCSGVSSVMSACNEQDVPNVVHLLWF